MNKNKNNTKHRRLELKRETVIHLTDDMLKNAVGGDGEIQSVPISACPTQCPNEA